MDVKLDVELYTEAWLDDCIEATVSYIDVKPRLIEESN